MKKCSKCKKYLPLESFYKDISKQYKRTSQCKKCISKKTYYYKKLNPWKSSFKHAKERCRNPNNHAYKYYGGRGIKFLMTKEEVKWLWFRDKAWLLKKPSIDRIDSNGNYEFKNCEFVERKENSRRGALKQWQNPEFRKFMLDFWYKRRFQRLLSL